MRYVMILGIVFACMAFVGSAVMLRQQPGRIAEPASGTTPGPTMVPRPSPTPEPFTYVALGDSTVYGTGASSLETSYVGLLSQRLAERYENAQTVNLGVNGATAADVLAGQLARAVELQPDLVTISVGPNDITQGRDAAAYDRDMGAIFQRLREETDALVVVNSLPDLAVAPRLTPQQQALAGTLVKHFNAGLTRQAQLYDVVLVDVFLASREAVPGHPELLAEDYYHPSDRGYARWAEIMWRGIEPNL